MCSNMKSYYFSVNSVGGEVQMQNKLTWMHLKVFKVYLFTKFNVSNSFNRG